MAVKYANAEELKAANTRLRARNTRLRHQLEEMRQLLEAIRRGAVDAFVVEQDRQPKVFTLTTAERPFRTVVETMNEGAATMAEDGTILYCNQRFADILGRSSNEILGRNVTEFLPAHEIRNFQRMKQALKQHGTRAELTLTAAAGRDVAVYAALSLLEDSDVRSMCLVVTDISDLKRKNKDILEQALRAGRVISFEWDPRTDNVTRSENASELFGHEAATSTGAEYFALIPPDDRARFEQILQNLTPENNSYRDQHRLRFPDGRLTWVEESGEAIFDQDGNMLSLRGLFVDITERRQTEEALRRAQSVAKVGNWLMNVKSNKLTWSDEIYRIFGVPPGTPLTYESVISFIHPDDRAMVDKAWHHALESRTAYNVQHRIIVDGKVKWVQETAELEYDTDGSLLGAFGTAQDITKQKEAEEAIRKSREDFIRGQKMAQAGNWKLENGQWEWSEETYRIFEVPLGTPVPYERFLECVHPEDRDMLDAAWKKSLEGASSHELEHRICVPSGIKWIREKAEMEYDETGNVSSIFGIAQDITALKQAQQQLLQRTLEAEESKRLLDAIMEHVPVGIMVIDVPDTTIRLMSRFGAHLINHGMRKQFENTQDWRNWKLIRPDGQFVSIEQMPLYKAVYENQAVSSQEYRIHTGKNMRLHLLISAGPIRNEQGELIGAIAIWQDITELKTAERQLQQRTAEAEEGKRLLDAIMEYIPVGLTIVDARTNRVHAISRSALKLLGASLNEIEGRTLHQMEQTWQILLPQDGRLEENELPVMQAIVDGETVSERELQVMSRQQTLTPVLASAAPIRDERGNITAGIVVWQDISLRKKAEQQLRQRTAEAEEAARLLNMIMEHVPVGIMVADAPHTRIRLISRFGAFLLDEGHRSDFENVLLEDQRLLWNLSAADGTEITEDQLPLGMAVQKGSTVENQEFILTFGKKRLNLLISAGPIRDGHGHIVGGILVWQDITELKKAEQSLQQSRQNLLDLKEQLENKNKELESIIGIVSHDLRSPIVSISGFSQEIRMSCQDADKALHAADLPTDLKDTFNKIINRDIPEAIDFIQSSASKMDSLVRSLVKVARAGMAEIRPEPLNMTQVVSEAAAAIGFEIKEAVEELSIEPLPECFADKTQVSQIFSNLVDNAVKYLDPSRPGRIRIFGRTEETRAVYCVQDNGIGISPEHLNEIFDLFSRLDRSKSHGEGIGLALVKRMVTRNNGSIWVESEPGKGSAFFISLPRLEAV